LFAQFSHTISSMITDFWDIAPCGIVEVGWLFRSAYCLHRQGDDGERISKTSVYFNENTQPLQHSTRQEVMGRTNSPAFPACHLFEVLEPNFMELNLSEVT
jgi:hypothetical protein